MLALARGVGRRAAATAAARCRGLSVDTPSTAGGTPTRWLEHAEHGAPENVLRLREGVLADLPPLGPRQLLIHVLAAPVNPADVNTVEGKYPLRHALPGAPGHEGVGVVLAAGEGARRARPGDRVVPLEPALGTWRSHGVWDEGAWMRIPKDLPLAVGATITVNPPTALRLTEDFVPLKDGDTLVQTGGASAVGRLVTQLAAARGVAVVSLVRPRGDAAAAHALELELKDLGAAAVVSSAAGLKAALAGRRPPRLALDCVGGDAGLAAARALAPGGTLVVYGNMSRAPVALPAGLLIFGDLRVRGFWLSGGLAAAGGRGRDARERLVDRAAALFRQRALRPSPVECVPLAGWRDALALHRDEGRAAKVLLTNYGEDVCL